MLGYREFAIQTASLAGLSLAVGCAPSADGDWKGAALITGYGDTFALPFSFTGTIQSAGWFGSSTREFSAYAMDMSLAIDREGAKLSRTLHKVYTYTYDYGEDYEPYVADVERTTNLGYTGTTTRVGERQFDIVLALSDSEQELYINDELQRGPEGEQLTTRSAVLRCGTDGEELHCFQRDDLLIFTQE